MSQKNAINVDDESTGGRRLLTVFDCKMPLFFYIPLTVLPIETRRGGDRVCC